MQINDIFKRARTTHALWLNCKWQHCTGRRVIVAFLASVNLKFLGPISPQKLCLPDSTWLKNVIIAFFPRITFPHACLRLLGKRMGAFIQCLFLDWSPTKEWGPRPRYYLTHRSRERSDRFMSFSEEYLCENELEKIRMKFELGPFCSDERLHYLHIYWVIKKSTKRKLFSVYVE